MERIRLGVLFNHFMVSAAIPSGLRFSPDPKMASMMMSVGPGGAISPGVVMAFTLSPVSDSHFLRLPEKSSLGFRYHL